MQNIIRITTVDELRHEKMRVQHRIERRRHELSLKLYEIPAELAAAGANSLIPSFLRGKVTNAALSGGKMLINKLLVPNEHGQNALPAVSKGVTLTRKIFSLFRRR